MPRPDDDFDDDRPRRKPRPDDEYDRPRRRPRDDEDDRDPPPRRKSNLGLILGIVGGVLVLICAGGCLGLYFAAREAIAPFRGAVTKVTEAADRMNSSNNMKQIGLATLGYEGKFNDFPNNSYGPDGKPLLSWRVHILPFIEEEGLYRQFKLDEPWDSPNNHQLLVQMPVAYATPAERDGRVPRGNKTFYRGFSGAGGAYSRRDPAAARRKLGLDQPLALEKLGSGDFRHGMTMTPVVVEAGDPVEWTKPDDLDLSLGKPFPKFGGVRPNEDSFFVLFADGSVRAVKRTVPQAEWRKAVNVLEPEPGKIE